MFVLITGLPSSGKTTLARATKARLDAFSIPAIVLDGDELRASLSKDLGFDMASRDEHLRRVRIYAKLLYDKGAVLLASLIFPLAAQRAEFRAAFPVFLEVFMDTPLETCRRRDPKGLYRRAYAGLLPGFTGVGSPYERPTHADLVIGHQVPADDAARLLCSKIL